MNLTGPSAWKVALIVLVTMSTLYPLHDSMSGRLVFVAGSPYVLNLTDLYAWKVPLVLMT